MLVHAIAIAALVVAIAAAVAMIVVLAYGAYEIAWKAKRLRTDLAQLQELNTGLAGLQDGIAAARARIATASVELR